MMNFKEQFQSLVAKKLPVKRWLKQINALPHRDRVALLAGGLALIVGIEFQVVMPMHDRRVSLLAAQPSADPLQAQQDADALANKQAELASLQKKLVERKPMEAVSVDGGSPRQAFESLRKAMALELVEIVALKALPGEEAIKAPTAANASDAVPADEPASDAAAATPPAEPASAPSVYRHRAELQIAGTIAQVNEVLRKFEQPNQLLRLEKVKVAPSGQAGHVEATLSLVFISGEQTWLAM